MRKVLALHFFGCGYLSVQAKFSAQNHRLLDKEPCLTAWQCLL